MFEWDRVCTARTAVMGIVNVTPDSFSDGGRFLDPDAAVAHGIELAEQGADVLDVGGESTRPGAAPVPADEELRRVVPVVERLAAAPGIGFGKTVDHNLRLLAGLPALAERVGVPVLVGTSRKTFVGKVLARAGAASGDLPVDQRDEGTLATVVWAVERGASIVRVHDVLPAVRAVRLLDALHSADAGAA